MGGSGGMDHMSPSLPSMLLRINRRVDSGSRSQTSWGITTPNGMDSASSEIPVCRKSLPCNIVMESGSSPASVTELLIRNQEVGLLPSLASEFGGVALCSQLRRGIWRLEVA